jgi:hypothetical protein
MIERFDLGTDPGLEAALADLGEAIAWPPTPDLAATVGARVQRDPVPLRRPGQRPLRRALLLAAALVLALAGAAVAIRLGLDLLDIRTGPIPSATPTAVAGAGASPGSGPSSRPAPSPTVADPGLRLGMGRAATLADALAEASFPILVPGALGEPDHAYLGGPDLRGQVAFLYDASAELPAADSLDGAGLLITQARGHSDDDLARKLVDTGLATIEAVTVDGVPGYWIAGDPHVFWYLAPDGTAIQESRRLVGDTLVWERDGILYRIEGAVGLERALEIAASMS